MTHAFRLLFFLQTIALLCIFTLLINHGFSKIETIMKTLRCLRILNNKLINFNKILKTRKDEN